MIEPGVEHREREGEMAVLFVIGFVLGVGVGLLVYPAAVMAIAMREYRKASRLADVGEGAPRTVLVPNGFRGRPTPIEPPSRRSPPRGSTSGSATR